MVTLGSKVKDKITGCTGIAISRTEWLNGCVRVGVQPAVLKDGVPVEPMAFDEQQLEVLKWAEPPNTKAAASNVEASGGPQDDPKPPVAASSVRPKILHGSATRQ